MRVFRAALCAMALLAGLDAHAQGLKDTYKDYFSVGVSVNMSNLNTKRNPKDMDIILTNYNSITARNILERIGPRHMAWHDQLSFAV